MTPLKTLPSNGGDDTTATVFDKQPIVDGSGGIDDAEIARMMVVASFKHVTP
ncbi:hypothetical protein HFO09_09100 [Rhizobium laguerreae]|uniref:hypothetical protein n=1 Tax=Rhizobium laguerreae TaxID=1076926 RepID=UPI001C90DCEE|nr:hypothetical protein [Rhizobium laguerreae]MBY3259850.1 hypothetical protein [Rhizobium laguerreae]MBY3282879.1 hypothetical protein [Rhizobium laguerreae]MBY3289233.1 hypothetical protein [Rhizobium laguerreae]